MDGPKRLPEISQDCAEQLLQLRHDLDAYDSCTQQQPVRPSTLPGSSSGHACHAQQQAFLQVERCRASELSYEQFVLQYMAPNRPVIIKGCADAWPSRQAWVTAGGLPHVDALEALAGSCSVCVTDTSRQADYDCCATEEMTVREYAAWWRAHHGESVCSSCTSPSSAQMLYLKDWHYASEHSSHKAYQLPDFFSDDWLNAYYDTKLAKARQQQQQQQQQQKGTDEAESGAGTGAGAASDGAVQASDYRFVYLGPAGSWTLLHADVLCSYSWSANVCGRKRWLLLPPQHTPLLAHRLGHRLAPHVLPELFPAGHDPADYPHLGRARPHLHEVLQEAGEALFVPSCWHHVVRNEAPTLSINHNWLNAHNLHWVWGHMRQQYRQAAQLIEDCRPLCSPAEFEALVQRNLAANAGLGMHELLQLLGAVLLQDVLGCAGTARHWVNAQAAAAVVQDMARVLGAQPAYSELLRQCCLPGQAAGAGAGSGNTDMGEQLHGAAALCSGLAALDLDDCAGGGAEPRPSVDAAAGGSDEQQVRAIAGQLLRLWEALQGVGAQAASTMPTAAVRSSC